MHRRCEPYSVRNEEDGRAYIPISNHFHCIFSFSRAAFREIWNESKTN